MKNTDKITLTFGQLKRLVSESIFEEERKKIIDRPDIKKAIQDVAPYPISNFTFEQLSNPPTKNYPNNKPYEQVQFDMVIGDLYDKNPFVPSQEFRKLNRIFAKAIAKANGNDYNDWKDPVSYVRTNGKYVRFAFIHDGITE